jgi:hypothetical protein
MEEHMAGPLYRLRHRRLMDIAPARASDSGTRTSQSSSLLPIDATVLSGIGVIELLRVFLLLIQGIPAPMG